MNWKRIGAVATSLPVRILISVGLLVIVAETIDWDAVVDGLADASWGLFVAAVALYFLAFVVASIRWHRLLNVADVHVSQASTLRAYLIGMFANNLLPSGYGGDAVRAWVVSGTGKPLARSVTSVLVDRISALLCLLLLAWIAALIKGDEIPGGIILLLGLATALVAIAGLAGLVVARRRGLGRFFPDAVRPYTTEIANVIRAYEHDRSLIIWVIGCGTVYQAMVLTGFWLISEALGLSLDPAILAVVVPTVLLAALAADLRCRVWCARGRFRCPARRVRGLVGRCDAAVPPRRGRGGDRVCSGRNRDRDRSIRQRGPRVPTDAQEARDDEARSEAALRAP